MKTSLNAANRELLAQDVLDAKDRRLALGDRAVDLNTGLECVLLDHIPELGPESLYVQMIGHDGPDMTYWVEPTQLMVLA